MRTMDPSLSYALVFFGATGDLAYKQIFPALQALVRRGHMEVPIVGVGRSGWGLDKLIERSLASIKEHGSYDEKAFAKLAALLKYVDGDYREESTFTKLHEALGGASAPLHYLAIPPSVFETVIGGLAKGGNVEHARGGGEKPFGRDLKT